MNLCAVLIDSKDYTKELSLLFTRDDDVLIPNEDKLIETYKISDEELQNMSVEEIIVDRITKLTVDM
jgi:KEOPS complex subunit Cgi121